MKKLLKFKENDYVNVYFPTFNQIRQGTIILQENGNLLNKNGKFKIDFHNEFVGWHEEKNIKIWK